MNGRTAVRYILLLLPIAVLTGITPAGAVAFLLVVLLPGLLLSGSLFDDTDLLTVLAVSIGAGVANTVIAGFVLTLLPLPLTAATVIPALAALPVTAAAARTRRQGLPRPGHVDGVPDVPALAVSGILTLGLLTRLLPVRHMNAPLFYDPAVQATVARLILDHGTIPATWTPLLPIPLNYQPGFPLLVGVVHAATGIPLPRLVLVLTSIFHAFLPLPVYYLGRELFGDPWKATGAAFITLLAAFPAYTFVAGMNAANTAFFLLPLLLGVFIRALRHPRPPHLAALAGFATALTLIHPIVAALFGMLSAIFLAAHVATRSRWTWIQPVQVVVAGYILPVLVGLVHFLPVLLNGPSGIARHWEQQAGLITPSTGITGLWPLEPFFVLFQNPSAAWHHALTLPSLPRFLGSQPLPSVLALGFVYAGILAWRRRDIAGRVVIAWFLVIFFLGPLQAAARIPFPGWQYVSPARFKFYLILPIALLIPFTLDQWDLGASRNIRRLTVIAVLMAAIGLPPVFTHMTELAADPVVSDHDRDTLQWIDRNVDNDAVILNTVKFLDLDAFVGDAGQWIPPYTGNRVVFPAVSNTGNVAAVHGRLAVMHALENRSAARFNRLLQAYNVSYIYLSENDMNGPQQFQEPSASTIRQLCDCEYVYTTADTAVLRVPAAATTSPGRGDRQ